MSQIVKLRRSSVSGQKPTNTNLQLGELALNTTDGKVFMAKSGSLGPSVEELITTNTVNTGSLSITGAITGSVFTGSFKGDATYLTNVPFQISGSDISGNTYNKTFTKLQFDDSTGLNVNENVPGTAFISIGSHFKDIFVSGSPLLSATGSDAFEVIGSGGIGITTSITDTNGNGYIKELNINATSLSSSLNNRIDVITGSINGLNTFTSSVVLTSQTGSMTVMSASYAVTAAFALNAGASGGGAIGTFSSLVVTSPSSTWNFKHDTGQRYPIFQVFDNSGNVVIPSQIQTIDNNNANIIFPSPQAGTVVASLGGGNGTTKEFTNSNLWVVDHNLGTDYPDVTVWDSNRNIILPNRVESINNNQIKVYFSAPVTGHVSVSRGGHIISGMTGTISGSLQLSNLGYAITGSNTFTSNQTINGTLSLSNSLFQQTTTTGSTGNVTVASILKTSYDGAFFDYIIKEGTNFRAGSVMSVWDGTTIKYNETTTNDIGDTSGVTMSVVFASSNAVLRATIASGTWIIKTITRGI
jgi:hypothetical protein